MNEQSAHKAWAALAMAFVTTAVQLVPQLEPIKGELTTIAVSVLTIVAVYAVRNRPKAPKA